VNSTYFFAQDTIVRTPSDTVPAPAVEHDSVTGVRKFSTEDVDDIFRAMEQRERALDSITRVRAYHTYLRSREQERPKGFDTAAVPYNFNQESRYPDPNPLGQLSHRFFSSKDTMKPVFLEQDIPSETLPLVEVRSQASPDSSPAHDLRPDWLLGLIIGSLVLLAWLKLFYNKFFDQTMQSLFNYQLSTKLLRDQNIFSRRVAFLLNLHFILIGAAGIYLIFGYFHFRPFPLSDILSYLAYAGILTGFLVLRFIASHAIGYIFDTHYEFREYQHQLLLIYKNLGIYLLVLVIGIAYIHEDLRVYLVYAAFLLLAAALILRVIKGLKIIFTKKDILIFYLILYLCILEILPLLFFYRFFSLLIQEG